MQNGYGDGYNIRGRMDHHDGTNYTLYRIAKGRDEAERIADKIYNREIDEEGFRRRTRSLYPYVAACTAGKQGSASRTRPHKNAARKIPQRTRQRWLRYPY